MKSVLNYFVRKAFGFTATAKPTDKTLFGHLLRIRQNIHEVYEWLYARYPADAWWLARRMPMTEAVTESSGSTPVKVRPVAQNTDTLLAHLRWLDGRKISNGYADGTPAADGLPDGVSLARILCGNVSPTILLDDNLNWEVTTENGVGKLVGLCPNIEVHLNCNKCDVRAVTSDITNAAVLYFHHLKSIPTRFIGESSNSNYAGCPMYEVHMEALETTDQPENTYSSFYCGKVYLPAYKQGVLRIGGSASYSNRWMNYLYIGCKGGRGTQTRIWHYYSQTELKDIEIAEGARQTITISNLDGLTAENIALHILDRLADNRYEDDGVTEAPTITITLGATNIATIEADPAYAPYLADAQMKNYTIV